MLGEEVPAGVVAVPGDGLVGLAGVVDFVAAAAEAVVEVVGVGVFSGEGGGDVFEFVAEEPGVVGLVGTVVGLLAFLGEAAVVVVGVGDGGLAGGVAVAEFVGFVVGVGGALGLGEGELDVVDVGGGAGQGHEAQDGAAGDGEGVGLEDGLLGLSGGGAPDFDVVAVEEDGGVVGLVEGGGGVVVGGEGGEGAVFVLEDLEVVFVEADLELVAPVDVVGHGDEGGVGGGAGGVEGVGELEVGVAVGGGVGDDGGVGVGGFAHGAVGDGPSACVAGPAGVVAVVEVVGEAGGGGEVGDVDVVEEDVVFFAGVVACPAGEADAVAAEEGGGVDVADLGHGVEGFAVPQGDAGALGDGLHGVPPSSAVLCGYPLLRRRG